MVTPEGFRIALFFLTLQARIFHPGLSLILPGTSVPDGAPLRAAFDEVGEAIERWCTDAQMAA